VWMSSWSPGLTWSAPSGWGPDIIFSPSSFMASWHCPNWVIHFVNSLTSKSTSRDWKENGLPHRISYRLKVS
jgi:hypothetical protein